MTRIKLEVYVNLDETPGTFHSTESARNVVARILENAIPHYSPMVSTGRTVSSDLDRSDEMDRNARGYGWEIGHGHALVPTVEMSGDNPFSGPDWRNGMKG